jgi:hypothetical protein
MIDKHQLFRQASEFTKFHKKLSVFIKPYLNPKWTMADIGCGLALLDFELADSVLSITAIDKDASALAEVDKHIDEELAANKNEALKIETMLKDAHELGDEQWDVVLMSFFGAFGEERDDLLSLARHRGIIITHARDQRGRYDPIPTPGTEGSSADKLEAHLKKRGYSYRKSVVDMQLGQPFKTIEDIHEFLDDYNMDKSLLDLTGGTDAAPGTAEPGGEWNAETLKYSAEDRIIKTQRYDFPYYLPRNLSVAIFVVVNPKRP